MNNSNLNQNKKSEQSFKEKRIRELTLIYYSQPAVKKAILDFSKNRECIPRYYDGFGKRPDTFQYEEDILEQVKKGATSFHCSEELWEDPLEVSTDLNPNQLNELREGWDLLLDIDSPYLEYSKIYTRLLIEALRFYGVKNMGVKFSGSKGFHVIIPWKSFPKEIYGQQTKNMFPEWPRIICQYLSKLIQPKLEDEILKNQDLKQIAEKTGKQEKDLLIKECNLCKRPAEKKDLITWVCPYCKIEREMQNKTKRIPKCPECRKELIEKSRKEVYYCEFCEINSNKNSELFNEKRFATEKLIEADLILVAPRHLFRMPYSLHEKTALSSIVLNKNKIMDFQIKDAKPFKSEVKSFCPEVSEGEARGLLLNSLDWKEEQDQKENQQEIRKKQVKSDSNILPTNPNPKTDFKQVVIPNPNDDIFPPCIKIILKGIKQDGRKRALFILINFFKSLGVSEDEIEKRINNWNEKNYQPLKKGYIISQLNWYKKTGARMPPNCDKSNYKDLNFCKPDELCRQIKNPINYAVKRFFQRG